MQLNADRILGGGGYAFRPGTELTRRWIAEVENRVRVLTPALERNPGMYAKERNGDVNDGIVSHYPVPWLHLAGDVLHPLAYKFRRRTRTVLPLPDMFDYQDPRPEGSSGPRDLTKD